MTIGFIFLAIFLVTFLFTLFYGTSRWETIPPFATGFGIGFASLIISIIFFTTA